MVRFTHNERGAAAVEFAIVLPLLRLLVFGIVEFSALYNPSKVSTPLPARARCARCCRHTSPTVGHRGRGRQAHCQRKFTPIP